jgi:hypothetical protein
VLANMSRTPCMLIMLVVIKLIVSEGVLVRNEPNIIRDMLFLNKVLNVETKIDHSLVTSQWVIEGHKEAACNFVNQTSRQLKFLLYLGI